MTDRTLIAALVNAIEQLSGIVEDLGCTCLPEDNNKLHAPSRRRSDSRCTGVKLAVKFRGLARRAHRRLSERFPGESGADAAPGLSKGEREMAEAALAYVLECPAVDFVESHKRSQIAAGERALEKLRSQRCRIQ